MKERLILSDLNDLSDLVEALVPRWQLQIAQVGVDFLQPEQQAAIRGWLGSLPGEQTAWRALGVSWVVDGDRIRWFADGEADAFIPVMADYFAQAGVAAAALEQPGLAGELLNPDRIGYWLEARPGGLNLGWYFAAERPLSAIKNILPDGRSLQTVARWAKQFNRRQISRVGRALGQGNPYSELHIPLTGMGNVEKQIYAALQLFADLPAQAPPDDALAFLMNGQHEGLLLSLALTPNGVIKAGIAAQKPDTMLMLDLISLAGVTDVTKAAQVEGALFTGGPAAVECQTRAAGFTVELHYHISEPMK